MENLQQPILKAVENYNRYRSPEATAKLVEFKDDRVIIEFAGSFCWTCGVFDYLDDFIYELKDLIDIDVEMMSTERVGLERIRVQYNLKN